MPALPTVVQCPSCAWKPPHSYHWICTACEYEWNIFHSYAVCPQCGHQEAETVCKKCHESFPHKDWYQGSESQGFQILHYPTAETLEINFDPVADFYDYQDALIDLLSEYVEQHPAYSNAIFTVSLFPGKKDPEVVPHILVDPEEATLDNEELTLHLGKLIRLIHSLDHLAPDAQFMAHTISLERIESTPEDGNQVYFPAFVHPSRRQSLAFSQLSLTEKIEDLSQWARQEALPLLGAYAAQVDRSKRAIRSLGRRLPNTDFSSPREAHRKTAGDDHYWSAIIEEMNPADPLLIAMKLMLHVAHKQFDVAWNYLRLYKVFAKSRTLAFWYFEMFLFRFLALEYEIKQEIGRGNKLLAEGEYAAALSHYQDMLISYPRSAELLFARFLAARECHELGDGKASPRWTQLKEEIYAANPLFDKGTQIKDAFDAYHLALREEGEELLEDLGASDDVVESLIRLAFIALEVGDYAFAAHAYFILPFYRVDEITDRLSPVAFFFFCLNKLKIRGLVRRYKGNLAREAQLINRYRQALKEAHPAYKGFSLS